MDDDRKSDAYLNGWAAHRSRRRVVVNMDSNPYNETTQAFSWAQWNSGYSARFSACKHDGDFSLDDWLDQHGV